MQVWKGWVGIILIGIGFTATIQSSNYWMILVSVLGCFLLFLDKNKIKDNENHQSIVKVTAVVVIIMVLKDLFGTF